MSKATQFPQIAAAATNQPLPSLRIPLRSGVKRGGASLLWAHEHERKPIPQIGDLEIVLDHRAEPLLLTRVLSVEVVAVDQVTAAHAAVEGEGDGSLRQWRDGHWAFFSRECARIGRVPEPSMPVVCSVFELLAQVASTASAVCALLAVGCRSVPPSQSTVVADVEDGGSGHSIDATVQVGSMVAFLIGPNPSIGVIEFTGPL